ncbi:hypothetical protein COCCU_13825 [Corynebacterium occultum]|uniref:Uncharacterized protein n=1 Tax=Corynebacterium occultum TaxID=2675219 RepID=A0A6B8WBH3_9CORY|nr:hypothetical protein [Corynebacterium occultum]QGU08655.1 hypothetical protein COCCU_13825 [Corynebacterium occultum]
MTLLDDLVAGPRGRDFLMEVALSSEGNGGPLSRATWRVGSYMERNVRKFGIDREHSARARATTVAPLLEEVPLVELAPRLLYDALEYTVFRATYWQEPMDGEVFLSAAPLRRGLCRIARHVADSEVTAGWSDPFLPDRQWSVNWAKPDPDTQVPSVDEALESWREEAQTESLWWSTPPWPVISTARELVDGTPGGLRFVEDGRGWETAQVQAATISPGARVFTINGPGAWAQLCRRFPLDVTPGKGQDWRLATGYPHGWVIPDFVQVAQHYDALHLSMRGYFATAGRVIPVDEEQAGLLAGWSPGQTFWFTDAVALGKPVTWRNHGHDFSEYDWRPDADDRKA